VAQVNLPVGILIWVMIIPMLVKVDFGALGQIRRHVKGIGVMTDDEVAAFANKYGYKPTFYRIALDALAIYVNKNNPIRGMTL
jgi:hypothetical protein